jgi:hypothetical protein
MIILTFSKDEADLIAQESPTFLAKISKIAKPSTLPAAPRPIDDEASAYLDTIRHDYGFQTCVQKLREWSKNKGILKYSSLAGAKRLVESKLRNPQ